MPSVTSNVCPLSETITHDISIAGTFADRFAVMMKGALVKIGAADTPDCPKRQVAAVPALGSLASRRAGSTGGAEHAAQSCQRLFMAATNPG